MLMKTFNDYQENITYTFHKPDMYIILSSLRNFGCFMISMKSFARFILHQPGMYDKSACHRSSK